jgi:hypothetical protein
MTGKPRTFAELVADKVADAIADAIAQAAEESEPILDAMMDDIIRGTGIPFTPAQVDAMKAGLHVYWHKRMTGKDKAA